MNELPQRMSIVPERYSHVDVTEWLQTNADPSVVRAWVSKLAEDDLMPRSDRIAILSEVILGMAADLEALADKESDEARGASKIVKLAKSIQP